jgi:16S rRNA (guanine527-N7)-methyltransferase
VADTEAAVRAALGRLGERHGLGKAETARLAVLLRVLQEQEHAPTAVRTPERALDVHVADSLAALELKQVRVAARIADIGAGAGLPGVVLAAPLPSAEVWLVESHARKCAFIEDLVAQMGLTNAHVVCARAEEWRAGLAANDVVVARALGPHALVLEYAAPLLRIGGALVDWRGRRSAEDEHRAVVAARELGLERVEIRRVEPYAGARDHHLHVFVKREETPERFPRRAGMARKRPLGA